MKGRSQPPSRTIVDLADRRRRRDREAYGDLVMKTFRDFEHADRRAQIERRADVERKGRERL